MERVACRSWHIEDYDAVGVRAAEIVRTDAIAVTVLDYAPGAMLGRHPAGWEQTFAVVAGNGWASGGDDERVALAAGDAVRWQPGEQHASGTETGMTAVVVQRAAAGA